MEPYRRFLPGPRARGRLHPDPACRQRLLREEDFLCGIHEQHADEPVIFHGDRAIYRPTRPHDASFLWWFNGEPFENSYAPMLYLRDAGFAWTTGSSPQCVSKLSLLNVTGELGPCSTAATYRVRVARSSIPAGGASVRVAGRSPTRAVSAPPRVFDK
jgi:hypothetical protein